ncbi:LysR family transcriptional regulator [Roseivivax sediminis]|uniref:DNA-binding transcriptional regulator, LysR family n=1 Tax=Roseivivax sediminis TaxID=936889 RepID=A0A1I1YRC1_9RHOB|nr:LysR family transcriptional regulator [Roseivivax sediminis]SFE22041.1 DNA-binding transcriptional regulator, LysR family [Roseivivax sediminis]
MNWAAMNFDWNQVRAFLATLEEGSLSAAARALKLTQPTLGRQVAALEAQLGVTLFDRVGRGLVPTEAGAALAEHVRDMGAAAERLSLAAAGQAQSAQGLVRITASQMYSAYLLPGPVAAIRAAHPGIGIEIVATDDLSDLRRREADIAVRNARPEDEDLIARRLRDDSGSLYATPGYLRRFAGATGPGDFGGAQFLGLSDNDRYARFLRQLGFPIEESSFAVTSESHLVHWAMTLAGLGIGAAPVAVGDAAPQVQRILPGLDPIAFPIWLVAPQELRTSRRVRLVFDLLADAISGPGSPANTLDAAEGPA